MSTARAPASCLAAAGRVILAGSVLAVASAAGVPVQAGPMPTVEDARLAHYGTHTSFALDLDRPVSHEMFTLADDYRLVIDLPEVRWEVEAGALLEGAGFVKRVRYARNRPGRSRVVLDLSRPLRVANKSLVGPESTGRGHRLVLDLQPTDREAFVASAGWPVRRIAQVAGSDVGAGRSAGAPPRPRAKPQDLPGGGPAGGQGSDAQAGAQPMTVADLLRSTERRAAPRKAAKSDATKPIIVLDPGHGGRDPGAIGVTGVYEKTVALSMAKDLREVLESSGRYEVHMTRNRDTFVKLPDRVAFARNKSAAIFISIHADSNKSASVRGTSVYTLSEKASDEAAAKLAKKENAINGLASEQVNDDVLKILIELAQRDTMNSSVRFAQTMLPAFEGRGVGLLRNTHRFGPFMVLTAADVPSVLLEMGFLSSRKDTAQMTSPKWRKKLAGGIRDALDEFFGYSEFAGLDATSLASRP